VTEKPGMAKDDPRVIASREEAYAIPQWRLIKLWKAAGRHVDLLNKVIDEKRAKK
jgi:hypothetical protein